MTVRQRRFMTFNEWNPKLSAENISFFFLSFLVEKVHLVDEPTTARLLTEAHWKLAKFEFVE